MFLPHPVLGNHCCIERVQQPCVLSNSCLLSSKLCLHIASTSARTPLGKGAGLSPNMERMPEPGSNSDHEPEGEFEGV